MTGPAAALQFLRRRPVGITVAAAITLLLAVVWLGNRGGGSSANAAQVTTPVALPASLFPSPSPSVDPGTTTGDTAPAVPQKVVRRPPAIITPEIKALKKRVDPDVFVRLDKPVSVDTVRQLLAKTGGNAELVATGDVAIGTGTTEAVGVDPATFRQITPPATASSTALWQSVAHGNVAVAHAVAKALAVGLGDDTTVASHDADPYDFRVGAYATTGLPGIGVVIDQAYDSLLALQPNTGIVISASGRDPAIVAALAQQFFGGADAKGVEATALRIATTATGQGLWVAPAGGPITSGYGYRTSPTPEFHAGIDIGAPFGAPIYAASAGVVSYAGPASGYGNEVILSHPGGISTVYGHMEKILVTPGQPVRAGQPIALVGSEGDATGPHLHFEVHIGDQTTDPVPWLISHGVNIHH